MESCAEVLVPSAVLTEDLDFFTKVLGFRLELIYPADDPRVAVVSGHGLRLRLERGATAPAPVIRIRSFAPLAPVKNRMSCGVAFVVASTSGWAELVPT